MKHLRDELNQNPQTFISATQKDWKGQLLVSSVSKIRGRPKNIQETKYCFDCFKMIYQVKTTIGWAQWGQFLQQGSLENRSAERKNRFISFSSDSEEAIVKFWPLFFLGTCKATLGLNICNWVKKNRGVCSFLRNKNSHPNLCPNW